MMVALALVLAMAAGASAATVTLQDVKGPPSTTFTVTATGYAPGETVAFAFAGDGGHTVVAGGDGTATTTLTASAATVPGKYPVTATGATSHAVASAVFLVRTNWAQARFTEKRGGVNPFENVLNPTNVGSLTTAFDQRCGWGGDGETPTVASGRAYVASTNGLLCAFNKASGKPLWASRLRGPIVAPVAAAYTNLYVTAGSTLVVLSSTTGKRLWSARTGGRILKSSPTVYKGRVYVGSGDGYLYAYDAAGCGGARYCWPLWRGRVGRRVLAAGSAWGHYVFVTAADGSIRKFDANGCGRPVCNALATAWGGRYHHDNLKTSVSVVGQTVYAGFGDGRVSALRASDLTTIATVTLPWRPRVSSPAVTKDIIYVTTSHGRLQALDRATLAPLWSAWLAGGSLPVGRANGPAVANGVVYVGNGAGGTQAFAAAGCGAPVCAPLWGAAPHGGASAVVSDGRLYTGSKTGVVAFGLPF